MPELRRFLSKCLAPCLFLAPLLVLVGCARAPEPVEDGARVVDLIESFSKAKFETVGLGKVMKTSIAVGGETREVLFMHPVSRVSFPPVRLTREARLELSFGINEKVWGEGGDGVQFSVYAQPSRGEKVRIFSSYLDPKHVEADRRWAESVVALEFYAGQSVVLILETDPGPAKDFGWDWSGWSRATLTLSAE